MTTTKATIPRMIFFVLLKFLISDIILIHNPFSKKTRMVKNQALFL
nr:MAG TPA: hypothetical protein [Caudoviricetes sp.]